MRNNFLNIKFILVPQGAEYNAVSQALKKNLNNLNNRNNLYPLPEIVSIPVGGESVRIFLRQWLENNNFTINDEVNSSSNTLSDFPRVLVMGLCGSLNPELKVGDIVVCESFRYMPRYMADGEILLSDRPLTTEVFQYLNQDTNINFNTQSQSLKEINITRREKKNHVPQVSLVTGLTSDSVICTALEKRSLHECYGTNVVDMEGYAILEVLNKVGFSVATIRVVSDDCFHNIPNLTSAFNPDGSLNILRLVFAMLRKPLAAVRLIRGSLYGLKVLKKLSRQLKITDSMD